MAIEAGDDFPVRPRVKGNMATEPGAKRCRHGRLPILCSGGAQAESPLTFGGEAD
jgi:hypothetical protein